MTAKAAKDKMALLPMDILQGAADCLKVMAHPVRLRIVDLLMQGEFPVHEIATYCDLPDHQACGHLRLLQGRGYLDSERRGRAMYYRIVDERLPTLVQCIRASCRLDDGPTS